MHQLKTLSKKLFVRTLLFLLLFTAAFDVCLFYGFKLLSTTGVVVPDKVFFNKLVPVSVVLCLFFSILLWAALRSAAAKILQAGQTEEKKPDTPEEQLKIQEKQNKRFFLHLLSTLQRDARLLDFFSEKLEQFEDAQIGAAVRNIHENSNKTIQKYLSPKPVIDNAEGEEVTIDKGFDPAAVKLTGNVTGEPPFKGVLRHKGWQAGSIELPVLSERENSMIISPAEVEIK